MKTIKTTIAVILATLTLAACTENQTVIEPMRRQNPQPTQTNSEADTTQLDRTQDARTTDMMRLPTSGQNGSQAVSVNSAGSGNGSSGSSAPAIPRTDSPAKTVMPVDSLEN